MTTTTTKPTVDRLRHDIDSGHTRDKVAWPDPSAVPLGTDEECAGTPVHHDHVAQAYQSERGRWPDAHERTPRPVGAWVLVFFIVAFAAAMIMAGAMT